MYEIGSGHFGWHGPIVQLYTSIIHQLHQLSVVSQHQSLFRSYHPHLINLLIYRVSIYVILTLTCVTGTTLFGGGGRPQGFTTRPLGLSTAIPGRGQVRWVVPVAAARESGGARPQGFTTRPRGPFTAVGGWAHAHLAVPAAPAPCLMFAKPEDSSLGRGAQFRRSGARGVHAGLSSWSPIADVAPRPGAAHLEARMYLTPPPPYMEVGGPDKPLGRVAQF
jgi:hypothetical protein